MNKAFEKIIDELKQESIIVDNDAGHRAVEIIEQIAEEYNNGWIPCSERLPSKEEFIKSYIGKMYGAEFIVMIEGANRPTTLYYTLDGMWKDDYGKFHKVIAWRLLPEPYKGSSKLGKENYV